MTAVTIYNDFGVPQNKVHNKFCINYLFINIYPFYYFCFNLHKS